jgi:hypothetical protein
MKKVVISAGLLFLLTLAASAQSDIHRVDFKNFTYHPHCASEDTQTVRVKNGEYSKETQMDGYVDHFYFNVFDVAYGDLNGDSKDEAVVLTSCNTGGTGNFTEGFVFMMKAGKPALIANIPGGDRADGGLRRAWITGNILTIDANYMGEEGGACCPEYAETTNYMLIGTKLEQQGEPVRRSLYPVERVKFDRGTSGTTFKVRIPFEEGKRYAVGARAGQTLTVSVDTDKAAIRLLGDMPAKAGTNNVTARLPRNGDYTVEIQNDAETEIEVTVSIKIK